MEGRTVGIEAGRKRGRGGPGDREVESHIAINYETLDRRTSMYLDWRSIGAAAVLSGSMNGHVPLVNDLVLLLLEESETTLFLLSCFLLRFPNVVSEANDRRSAVSAVTLSYMSA